MATTKDVKPIWDLISIVISAGFNCLLFGPPGTGKTWAALREKSNVTKNQNVYAITLTEETPMAELRGHFIPSGGDAKLSEQILEILKNKQGAETDRDFNILLALFTQSGGTFKWHDGPAIRAWREGGRLVLNEIDRASGDVFSFLYAICDNPETARLTLPTGETVQPAPGFQVIATTNSDPSSLPEALADRFPAAILVNEAAPGNIAALPAHLQGPAKKTLKGDGRISTRKWHMFAQMEAAISREVAGQAVFGPRWAEVQTGITLAAAK